MLELLCTSDCTIVVVSGGLGSTRCEAPSPVLVVTGLWELVFELERPTCKNTGVCVRSMIAFLAPIRYCFSRQVHQITLSYLFLVDLGPLGARSQARFCW